MRFCIQALKLQEILQTNSSQKDLLSSCVSSYCTLFIGTPNALLEFWFKKCLSFYHFILSSQKRNCYGEPWMLIGVNGSLLLISVSFGSTHKCSPVPLKLFSMALKKAKVLLGFSHQEIEATKLNTNGLKYCFDANLCFQKAKKWELCASPV